MLCEEKGSLLRQIDELKKITSGAVDEITTVRKQNDALKCQSDGIQSTLTKVLNTVTSIEDQVVYKTEDPKVKELMVLMYSEEKDSYVVLRTQERNKKQAMKNCKRRYGNHFEEAFNVIAYQNPRNLLHRFKDYVNGSPQLKQLVKFHRTTFQTSFTMDHIKEILLNLENTFHDEIRVL
jgi:hypothetical protein